MITQALFQMAARVAENATSDVPRDDLSILTSQSPICAALHAAEQGDTRNLITTMREVQPDDQEMVLKHVLARAFDHESSLAPLLAMTMLVPRHPNLHTGLGFVHLLRENHAAAARSFRRTLALDPNNEAALLGCGVALQNLGEDEAAADLLMRVLKRNSGGDITRAAAVALEQLAEGTRAPMAAGTKGTNDEPIPYVRGTADNIATY